MKKKSEAERLLRFEGTTIQALLEKSRLLEMILDQIDALIYVKDTEGRYKYMNRNYHELFNFPHNEWEGRSDNELLNEDSAIKIRRNEQEVLMKGEPDSFEEVINVDGRERHLISYKVPLTSTESYSGWICGFATDITDFKREAPELECNEILN